jgi:RNA methyltransferase, RsmE family
MNNLFYAPDIRTNPTLPDKEAQHCLKVLRMQKGDTISLTDGKGYFYQAEITELTPRQCLFQIIRTDEQQPSWNCRIEIALAPTKNMERTEWFAEKATEMGINRIAFLKTRYSERKEIKSERVRKILISAMKQSLKAHLPELTEMTDFKQFVGQKFNGRKFIAHCHPGEKPLLSCEYKKGENALILIGPEGDFSEEEIALATANGFTPISLGESRLRTETAALTACQTLHIVNQLS